MTDYQSLTAEELRAEVRRRRNAGDFPGLTAKAAVHLTRAGCLELLTGQPVEPSDPAASHPVPSPSPAEPARSGGNGKGRSPDLADVLAEALKGKLAASVDPEQVREQVEKTLQETAGKLLDKFAAEVAEVKKALDRPRKVIVENPITGKTRDVGKTHRDFESLLKLATLRKHVFLCGPSAGGKTHIAAQLAEALELPFYMLPVGLQTTKTDLLGFVDATGTYRQTMLRQAYENGGLFLLDEVDAGNPNVLTVINALLANHRAAFPDGMVTRHKDFVFMAAANTYGLGADMVYVGRNQLDGATRNRFAFWPFDYDEDLERELCADSDWCRRVQSIRKAAMDLGEKVIVSPRASYDGAEMLAAGFKQKDVEFMTIWQGVSTECRDRILAQL